MYFMTAFLNAYLQSYSFQVLSIPVGGAAVVGAAKLKPALAVLLVVATVPKRNGTEVPVLEVVVGGLLS